MALAIKQDQKYTFADYESWPEDERWEIIEGVPYAMAAPSRLHQAVVAELLIQIGVYLRDKPCEIYPAPFNVRLPVENEANEFIETTIEPDLSIICDPDKLDDKGCRGAPDWIIEVLSPTTALRDMNIKRDLYQQHGVKEYWIVHPLERWVMIYTLDDAGNYAMPLVVGMDEATPVSLFVDLAVDWEFLTGQEQQEL